MLPEYKKNNCTISYLQNKYGKQKFGRHCPYSIRHLNLNKFYSNLYSFRCISDAEAHIEVCLLRNKDVTSTKSYNKYLEYINSLNETELRKHIKKYPFEIVWLSNCSDELKWIALKKDIRSLRLITYLTDEMIWYVINKDPKQIKHLYKNDILNHDMIVHCLKYDGKLLGYMSEKVFNNPEYKTLALKSNGKIINKIVKPTIEDMMNAVHSRVKLSDSTLQNKIVDQEPKLYHDLLHNTKSSKLSK